jgi:hypothetical protein
MPGGLVNTTFLGINNSYGRHVDDLAHGTVAL